MFDFFLGRTGQQLHDETACAAHTQVFIHQHAQGADSGDLLTDGKVGRDVLGNLAGGQRHLADVWLPHAQIADNIQRAVFADGCAHVQVAVRPRGQLHDWMLHIALDITGTVGDSQQTACGAAALDLQSHRVLGAFEHNAHH